MISIDAPLADSTLTVADVLPDTREYDPYRAILFREVMDVVSRTRPIDQERVSELLSDSDVKGKRGQNVLERNRIRANRYVTLRTIRTMVESAKTMQTKAIR